MLCDPSCMPRVFTCSTYYDSKVFIYITVAFPLTLMSANWEGGGPRPLRHFISVSVFFGV